jgi:hypothetical protein
MSVNSGSSARMSEKEFVLTAIRTLRKDGYTSIHTVYSGFNVAFRKYFGTDPVTAVKKFEVDGVVVTQPRKGGAAMWIASEAPPEVVAALAARNAKKDKPAKVKKPTALDKILAGA